MANIDRGGLKFVKSLHGNPYPQVYTITPGAEDYYRGDVITITTAGVAAKSASGDATMLGVVVGFGKIDDYTGDVATMFDPDDLEKEFFDTSADTEADYRLFYVPINGNVFEVQTASALGYTAGDTADLATTAPAGSSSYEITTTSNADVTIIEVPSRVDNDTSLANYKCWVVFNAGAAKVS